MRASACTAGAALLRHTEVPATSPDGPGMFAQSDPGLVTDTLSAAGLVEPGLLVLRLLRREDAATYAEQRGDQRSADQES